MEEQKAGHDEGGGVHEAPLTDVGPDLPAPSRRTKAPPGEGGTDLTDRTHEVVAERDTRKTEEPGTRRGRQPAG